MRPPASSLLSLADQRSVSVPPRAPSAPPVADLDDAFEELTEADLLPSGNSQKPPSPVDDMRDRYALGDFSGALESALVVLKTEPNHPEAKQYAESCKATLLKMYHARIGPLTRTPVVTVPAHQLRWLSLDHRAGFFLSMIDGMSDLETILDMSGMGEMDALKILYELVQQRVIAFK